MIRKSNKLTPLFKPSLELTKLLEKAERDKDCPFRKYYNPNLDFKLLSEKKSRDYLKDKGIVKLSLNEAYRHVKNDQKKFKYRVKHGGKHNFE